MNGIDAVASSSPKLLDQMRTALRVRHRTLATEKAYVDSVKRYILFHGKRHPRELGETEINAFLSHLAVEGKVSASTQNQALNAVVFLYRHVLKKDLGKFDLIRAKRPERVPVVLSRQEVRQLHANSPNASPIPKISKTAA